MKTQLLFLALFICTGVQVSIHAWHVMTHGDAVWVWLGSLLIILNQCTDILDKFDREESK